MDLESKTKISSSTSILKKNPNRFLKFYTGGPKKRQSNRIKLTDPIFIKAITRI